ncbi:MAG TPA: methylamine utilization protein [Thermoanaerobaculia bacterium]|jgi:plastocyanin|nr:methylamine utilization protein [Thermoanaerobaculia bacterium]
MRAFLLVTALALPMFAGTIDVRVQNARGGAIRDAVVFALPEGKTLALAQKSAVMDQKNRMFIPHVLPVQTGTAVRFPNSDDIRHHVYSFSPAKSFQLPLYKGTPANPEVFDKSGVVSIGCNIHDQMTAFIVVVDTPYFEKTPASGRVTLRDLAPGRYTLRVWYPDMRDEPKPQSITVTGSERASATFVAK